MSLYDDDAGRVAELASQHCSDTEIALAFATNSRAVYSFRKKHGIPAGRRGGSQPGPLHKGWKGGRVLDKSGYVLIHQPSHPNCNSNGYVREHRLVMEAHIGRYLDPKEVVHHKPGCAKDDNRIENLTLYSNNSDHLRDELAGRVPNWTEDGLARIQTAVQKPKKKGWKLTPEQKQAISDRMKGRKFSDEARANMSAAQKNKPPVTEETRAKLREARKHVVRSPEARAKCSAALKGRVIGPDWRAKLSAAAKARCMRKSQSQHAESQVPDNHPA